MGPNKVHFMKKAPSNLLLFTTCFTILTLSNCSSDDKKALPEGFELQGHRGCRGYYPENTIPAFIHALELGANTLEMDVVISKDSQVVVSHEPWFAPEFCSKPDGSPVLGDELLYLYLMDYDSIRKYDCGKRGNPKFPQQKAMPAYKPLLRDVIDSVKVWCKSNGKRFPYLNIETKIEPGWENRLTPSPDTFMIYLYQELERSGVKNLSCIQSFDVRTLQYLQTIDGAMTTALLIDNNNPVEFNLSQLGFLPSIYSPDHKYVTPEMIAKMRELGMRIIPWTVNEKADIQKMVDMGVDGIISDYPDRFFEK